MSGPILITNFYGILMANFNGKTIRTCIEALDLFFMGLFGIHVYRQMC